ncbi:DUF1456 family protein [Vibrio cholerae]|uniref:DUF1456 family protein n=1 Tax=Vibrio cholerae TaxID=666 RepID=UPI0004E2B0A2|nr:DUF1456 family protein [Vibrio cholerae]KFE28687.1 hypothetical protein DN30_274 [Vibrio cholerae]MDX5049917.1 DUF1456 family protein [Vibrio cholerae]TXY44055.1 DUF1456 family protein [Vibrio cholerae]HAS5670865.1 DUF1456 family protein [Vibrio cholerae]HAS5696700.1 DUF1456 family protein [Vibrio cholerae]
MTNNDVFRNILHLTGVGRNKELLEEIFRLGGVNATQSKIKGWRTSLDNPRASHMPDQILNAFFQGMFEYRDSQASIGHQVFNFPIENTLAQN